MDHSARTQFWVALLSAMAREESGLDPSTQFVEPKVRDASGKKVVSRGLLQISIESANQQRYGCDIAKADDLHDPTTNLACGVKILNYWVAQDGYVGAQKKRHVGGARYWSVLRDKKKLAAIQGFTRQLEACASRKS